MTSHTTKRDEGGQGERQEHELGGAPAGRLDRHDLAEQARAPGPPLTTTNS
jgi:hypothetical protein